MNHSRLGAIGALLALSLAGCDKSESNRPTPTTTVEARPVDRPAPAVSSGVEAEELPSVKTEADFEDDAERAISPDNLEAKVAELAKEIDAPE